MIVMLNSDSPKIDAAITMFFQFNIIETVRTGKMVMARGEQPTQPFGCLLIGEQASRL
jgi:acetolactate synthase-1/3 small subunit